MFSKKIAVVLVVAVMLGLLGLVAACGGAAPQPEVVTVVETVVVTKEVQGETVTVVETVEVEKEVIKEVEVEKEVIKEVEVDPDALPPEETLFYEGTNAGTGDIPTIDPSLVKDSVGIQFASEIFVGPTHLNELTGEVEPGMATDWTISDDGLVYTFKLREDVPWVKYNNTTGQVEQVLDEEGNPRMVNANDFIYGIKRTLAPETASDYAYVNWIIQNAQEVNGAAEDAEENPLYGQVDEIGVRAVDDYTLEFTLKEPAAFFPGIASMWMNWAQPQWLIEEKGDRWIEAGVIQTYGPYTLKAWEHDVSATLMANPFWPGTDAIPSPSIKYVHVQFLDQSAKFANYEADLVDVSEVPLPERDRVRADPVLSKEYATPGELATYYWGFNTTKPPFDDVNVRKAFSWAVDRTSLIENVVKGGQQPARWFARPGLTAASNPDEGDDFGAPVTAEIDLAKQFLAESSYGSPDQLPEITFMTNQVEGHVRIAEAIQQMLKENLGVDMNIVTQEWKVYLETLDEDPPQLFRLGWSQDYPDADNFLRGVFRSDSPNNHTKWGNPEFDRLVDEAARETDPAKRKELYRQAEEILIEQDVAIIPLYWYTKVEITKPYVNRTYSLIGNEAFEKWTLDK